MRTTIEELYYGNIMPYNRSIRAVTKPIVEYKKLILWVFLLKNLLFYGIIIILENSEVNYCERILPD